MIDKLRPSTMPWKQMTLLDNVTQEAWFDMTMEPLIALGYIDELIKEPDVPTFELFPGLSKPYKKKKNVIMHPTVYTPDRILKWNACAAGIFYSPFDGDNKDWNKCYFTPQYEPNGNFYYSILDIKGPTGSQAAYGTKFSYTQKWLWANSQQYVQKVMLMPIKPLKNDSKYLWANTFTPERFLYSDKLSTNKNKPIPYRTIPNKKGVNNWEVRTIKQFLETKKASS